MNEEKQVCDIAGLLRSPADIVARASGRKAVLKAVSFLAAISAVGAALYGFAIGAFSGPLTGLLDALKLGGVVLFAFVLTYPSLYVFSTVCGCGLSAARIAVFGLVATATTGCILASLAPVLWIFSVSTESAAFVIVFSVVLAGVAMGIAFRPVLKGGGEGTESPNKAFVIWAGLYLFVALQAVTLLRPMLGDDDGGAESRGKCFFLQHFAEAIRR